MNIFIFVDKLHQLFFILSKISNLIYKIVNDFEKEIVMSKG